MSNRTIMFRGLRVDGKGWVFGHFNESEGTSFIAVNPLIEWHNDSCVYTFDGLDEVIPESVGQFTGLLDSNRQEMFDGDIVECEYYSNLPTTEGLDSLVWRGQVVWGSDGSFHVIRSGVRYGRYSIRYGGSAVKRYEVIGNIHQDKELLEGGAE